MEMTIYQAVFAVLLIFFVGDLVGALTKAKISSMFVIMMGFLVLFLSGIYPANIMEISGFAGLAKLGQYFLLFNMGTSVDVNALKREWRTVLCAVIGMAAAILGCAVAIPLIGKEFALAAAALATFIYAVQKFIGTLPASNCGLSVANKLVEEIRSKHAADPNYSWYNELAGSSAAEKKTYFWEKFRKYYTTFICLAVAAAILLLSEFLGKLCQGWVNMSIWCMVLGIICRNTGLVPPNILRDFAKANGFFSFLSLCTIIPSLAKVDLSQLPTIGFAAVVIFVAVIAFTVIIFCFTPAWKIVGSKQLSIGIAMCQMIGYPGTELVATEITNAVAQTAEERDAVTNKIQTAYVISGFTSVTILSVFIASFLAKLL